MDSAHQVEMSPAANEAAKEVYQAVLGYLSAELADDLSIRLLNLHGFILLTAQRFQVRLDPIPTPEFTRAMSEGVGSIATTAESIREASIPNNEGGAKDAGAAVNLVEGAGTIEQESEADSSSEEFESLDEQETRAKRAKRVKPSTAFTIQKRHIGFLSSAFTVAEVAASIPGFQENLRKLRIDVMRSHKKTTEFLTEKEINVMTNFFYERLFGSAALRRVESLVEFVATSPQAENLGVAERALHVSQNMDLPLEVRQFFDRFNRYYRSEAPDVSIYAQTMRFSEGLAVYDYYIHLAAHTPRKGKAGPKDTPLDQLYKTSILPRMGQGRGLATAIHEFLAEQVGIEPRRLRELLAQLENVHLLGSTFGKGVLLLIPKGGVHQAHRFGNQKFAAVIKIASKTFRPAARVCNLLESYILNPIITGQPLPKLRLSQPKTADKAFVERLKLAEPDEEDEDAQLPKRPLSPKPTHLSLAELLSSDEEDSEKITSVEDDDSEEDRGNIMEWI